MLHYRESPPHPSLRDVVRCYYELRSSGPPGWWEGGLVPDGHLELSFNLSGSRSDWTVHGWASRPRTTVDEVMRTASRTRWHGEIHYVAAKLEHGVGLSWLGLSVQDVDDHPADGGSDPELHALTDRIEAAETWPGAVRALDSYFLTRRSHLIPDGVVSAAARRIRSRVGAGSVGSLAEELGVSRRTLQARVREGTGLSPKRLAQVVRVREAIRRVGHHPSRRLGRVAHDLGFCDQSHFIRDFRRVAGASPTDFFARPQFVADLIEPGASR